MNYVLKVFAGLLLAGVIALAARIVLVSVFYSATADTLQQYNEETHPLVVAEQQAIFEERRRKRQAAQEAKRQRQIEHSQRQQARRLQARFERERLQAFNDQYKLPKGCDWPRSEWQWTSCDKHKKAARQKFFDNYAAASINTIPGKPESVEIAARQVVD
jgi:hypothetical protein